jgi:hypothetical protein
MRQEIVRTIERKEEKIVAEKKWDRKKTNKKKRKHHNCDRDGEQDKNEKSENSQRRLSLPIQTECCCIPWESQPTINPTQKLCDWYQINQSINQSINNSESSEPSSLPLSLSSESSCHSSKVSRSACHPLCHQSQGSLRRCHLLCLRRQESHHLPVQLAVLSESSKPFCLSPASRRALLGFKDGSEEGSEEGSKAGIIDGSDDSTVPSKSSEPSSVPLAVASENSLEETSAELKLEEDASHSSNLDFGCGSLHDLLRKILS